MHISEGFLPISHCIGWGAASLVPAVLSVRTITRQMEARRENRVLLAASAAFLFTLSSLRMPSLTGSSSHPTGTALGVYLFGPETMPALALITLVFQALLLAHGGLTTLGANLFSLGIVGPWVTWGFLRFGSQERGKNNRTIFTATVAGDLATYMTTAVQLAWAYPSTQGGFLASFLKFTGVFLITQIPISIAEGMLTVALIGALQASRIESLESSAESARRNRKTGWRALGALVMLAALVVGMFLANRNNNRTGSDDQAQGAIQALRPGYRPIAHSLYTPGPLAEGLLFTLQGAAGVAILWWAIHWLRRSRTKGARPGFPLNPNRHFHPHLSDIAFTNHWRHRNPWEKVLFGGGFLLLALLLPPFPGAIVIALIVSLAAVAGARIPLGSWLAVLSIPVSFAMLTALGILVQIGGRTAVSIDWNSVPLAVGLLLRSTAAISCLAFIGWTTPLMELIPAFGRAGVPAVLIDLALMIYHFLFVTATTLREMRRAQSWRLGRADYKSRLRALSMLAGGLFVRCIERFRRLENGMEARGYDGRLWVLKPAQSPSAVFLGATIAMQAGLAVAALFPWSELL